MNENIVRSSVNVRIGELIYGKLGEGKDFVIPGVLSSKLATKTFIYKSESRTYFSVREEVFKAIYVFLECVKGRSLSDIEPEELSNMALMKHIVYSELKAVSIVQHSNVPVVFSSASLSADILGVLKALDKFFSTRLTNEQIYELASVVSITSPCLSAGVDLLFNPNKGEKVFNLPSVEYGVIYFDSKSDFEVDNVQVLRTAKYTSEEREKFHAILEMYQVGSSQEDYDKIFEATRESANINSRLVSRRNFSDLIQFSRDHNIGVFVNYSGGLMGFVMQIDRLQEISAKATSFVKNTWGSDIYTETSQFQLEPVS